MLRKSVLIVLFLTLASYANSQQALSFVLSAKGLPSGDTENVGSVLTEGLGSVVGHSNLRPRPTSESDAYIKVYSSNGDVNNKIIVGQSSPLKDTNDPAWNDVFTMIWNRGTGQKLHFYIFDQDVLDDPDPIGEGNLDLDEYVSSNEDKTIPLSEGGTLTIRKTSSIFFKVSVREIPSLDYFGNDDLSDPYVKIYSRIGYDGKDSKFYTTSTADNVRDYDWDERIEFNAFKRGSNQYLRFKVKDADTVGKDPDIGNEALLSLDDFVSENRPKEFSLGGDGGKLIVRPA